MIVVRLKKRKENFEIYLKEIQRVLKAIFYHWKMITSDPFKSLKLIKK